jgi:hypothetical protein
LLITSLPFIIDPEDLYRELYMSLEPDAGMKIDTAIVSHNAQNIFLLQTDRNKIYPSPSDEVIVTQINTRTLERKRVLQGIGLSFYPSPNGSKAIVLHPTNNDSFKGQALTAFCLLETESGECTESEVSLDRIQWIDDNTVIALSDEHRTIYRIDTISFEIEELFESWTISQITPIPSQNELLIAGMSAPDREIQFTVFDLSTSVPSTLPYGTETYCPALDYLSVSPNNQYMMYSCGGPTVLASYQTGEVVAEFEYLGFPSESRQR